jgi:hypothetical protein
MASASRTRPFAQRPSAWIEETSRGLIAFGVHVFDRNVTKARIRAQKEFAELKKHVETVRNGGHDP